MRRRIAKYSLIVGVCLAALTGCTSTENITTEERTTENTTETTMVEEETEEEVTTEETTQVQTTTVVTDTERYVLADADCTITLTGEYDLTVYVPKGAKIYSTEDDDNVTFDYNGGTIVVGYSTVNGEKRAEAEEKRLLKRYEKKATAETDTYRTKTGQSLRVNDTQTYWMRYRDVEDYDEYVVYVQVKDDVFARVKIRNYDKDNPYTSQQACVFAGVLIGK